jgi:hypothetical protein
VHFGVIGGDSVGDVLEDRRLAGFRRRHDQAALALAQRTHDVHDPGRQPIGRSLQPQPLVGKQRGQRVECGTMARLLGVHAVDRLDLEQRMVLLVVARGAHLAVYLVTATQLETSDLRQRHVDVGIGLGVALRA